MKKNKQTKKQKEATKTFWLVALVLALVAAIGLVQHHDDLKELANKDEDPITEEVEPSTPEVEVSTFTLYAEGGEFTFEYEVGMTWEEWINSDYNTFSAQLEQYKTDKMMTSISYDLKILDSGYVYYRVNAGQKTCKQMGTDLVTDAGLSV